MKFGVDLYYRFFLGVRSTYWESGGTLPIQQQGTSSSSSMFTLENQLQPPVFTVDVESPSVDMLRVF